MVANSLGRRDVRRIVPAGIDEGKTWLVGVAARPRPAGLRPWFSCVDRPWGAV